MRGRRQLIGIVGAALTACASGGGDRPSGTGAGVEGEDQIAVEVVTVETADAEDRPIVCRRITRPGSRIVIGETCGPVETTEGLSTSVLVGQELWDLVIVAPGVYEMRRRR